MKLWRVLLGMLLCAPVSAADDFVIRDIWLAQSDAGYSVQADLAIAPVETLENILQGGFEVRINFEMRFKRARKWWVDEDLGDIVWSPVLSYDSILKHYALENGGKKQTFPSLEKMLARAGRLRATPSRHPGFARALEDGAYILARLEMDYGNLPEPIKIDILTDAEWNFSSGWRRFEMRTQ